MAKAPAFICDICKKEIRIKDWTDAASGLPVTLRVPERNPLFKYGGSMQTTTLRPDDICWSCASIIGHAIADAIESRKKETADEQHLNELKENKIMSEQEAYKSLSEQKASRNKYWSECDQAEKIRRLHQKAKEQERMISWMAGVIVELRRHVHGENGAILTPLADNLYDGISRNMSVMKERSNDDRYF